MSAQIGRGAGGAPHGAASAHVRRRTGSAQRNAEQSGNPVSAWFTKAAGATATAMGTPWAFLTAVTIIAVWAISGPIFGFSDTWQLVINTGTTIVTFLMVFLIQNTQNRDAKAIHLKLDELIRAVSAARNELIDVEEDSDEQLAELQNVYRQVHEKAEGAGRAPLPSDSPLAGKAEKKGRRVA